MLPLKLPFLAALGALVRPLRTASGAFVVPAAASAAPPRPPRLGRLAWAGAASAAALAWCGWTLGRPTQ